MSEKSAGLAAGGTVDGGPTFVVNVPPRHASAFDRRHGTVDTPLAEPHGSTLAFLSDLHEQVERQISICGDETLRTIMVDLLGRLEAGGVLVRSAAEA
ncbi:hypothetical protein [Bradyrhizobium sp. CCBAU 51753]|uniref:hypothetical protein n=1 Tax=Bradyrhizobium sp. CCBAU 51753 TaxID=1325100 RepID=UPI00188BBBDC|nr:hypothetical protein [Bradyrhizobium sp. CCBAU 51753]QOZ25296.1 hypothetical protein XH93_18140 [Bradyrhizobium sp. CCBAU 51753]